MSNGSKEWDILEVANQATQFIEKNFKAALGVFIVGVLGASIYAFKKSNDASVEKEAFAELFAITKVYNDKKEQFDKAKIQEQQKKDAKKPEVKKDEKVYMAASGDLDKDYGDVVKNLESFITTQAGKKASGEAALTLAEIYEEYKKSDLGAETLAKVVKNWGEKDMLFNVMQMRAGDLYAASGVCDKAVNFWQPVAIGDSFLTSQAQLKLGVCYQEMGRVEEAKTWFTKIKSKAPNSPEGFNAKRYLRYLQFKGQVQPMDEKAAQTENKEKAS